MTNNAIEGWDSKLNSTIGKQQPNVFLQLQKLKEAVGILAAEIIGICKAWSKTKKDLCKTRQKNKIIMEEYINDQKKCPKTFTYINMNNYK